MSPAPRKSLLGSSRCQPMSVQRSACRPCQGAPGKAKPHSRCSSACDAGFHSVSSSPSTWGCVFQGALALARHPVLHTMGQENERQTAKRMLTMCSRFPASKLSSTRALRSRHRASWRGKIQFIAALRPPCALVHGMAANVADLRRAEAHGAQCLRQQRPEAAAERGCSSPRTQCMSWRQPWATVPQAHPRAERKLSL